VWRKEWSGATGATGHLSHGLPVGQIAKRGDGSYRSSLSRLSQKLRQFSGSPRCAAPHSLLSSLVAERRPRLNRHTRAPVRCGRARRASPVCLSVSPRLSSRFGSQSERETVFDLNQATPVRCSLRFFLMISFTYRCPRTGQTVHGHVADDLISGSDTYEPVTCTACGGIHLVNHKTGKLLEQAEKP
jgi:hypothetical protein